MNQQDFGIKRVSVDSSGNEANDDSRNAAISGDGRFVAFSSEADNLVAGDTNEARDIFLHDLETGVTSRVSVDSAGSQGNDASGSASISGNGRFVAFSSAADNLVEGDANERGDVFVHDVQTGVTRLVSVSSTGEAGNGVSGNSTISADGRFVAFFSDADNLVAGDTNEAGDIFIHEIETGITTRVSVGSSGEEASGGVESYSMSADGRFVAFTADGENLVPGEDDCAIYVRDRLTDTTTCISEEASSEDRVGSLSISNDGRFITFESVTIPVEPPEMVGAGDTRPRIQLVLHDRQTGESKEIPSLRAISGSTHSISADGRFIAFTQRTPDGRDGAFIYDIRSEITITTVIFKESENERTQSFSAPPIPTSSITQFPTFSADGSVIAFNSFDNLVLEDTNNLSDVFVLDNFLAANRAEVPPSEPLIGTAEGDRLLDLDNQDSIFGLEGDDTIDGGNGADEIFGNQGNDTIDGGRGNDEIFGNQGNDRIEGNNDSDTIYGGKDMDTLNGEGGDDWLRGDREEDSLLGSIGNDILFGGKGNDTLSGSSGDDRLSGDLGDDLLYGGWEQEQDTFVLAVGGGDDTISNFQDDLDRIEVTGGLTFSQLAFLPGEDSVISIVVAGTGEVIGTITRADEIAIAADDFIFS
jgi:Ca2+-binding RTX toxin-like protein